jgi:hypothetical protein
MSVKFNPDSEEGTTKVTKQHEIRSTWGISWLVQIGISKTGPFGESSLPGGMKVPCLEG